MEEEGEDNVRPDDWYFVDITGKRFRLPRTMLFIGREACDVLVKVDTVDKRHAVITFDHYLERFKIKDLSTTNKTYVNQCRIPEQEYVTLNHMDTVQLGYDSPEYHIEQGCNDNQLTSTTVKLQSTMITKPDTNSKTDCQGLTERHVETCNNHNENPTLHDGPPNYILPATTLNKPVMFFAGFEDDKATTEPVAEDSEETVVENRIISTTVSTNFFVPFDTNDDTEHEFISSQARKPQAPSQESTNEYDIYLKQEGTTNTTGLSHIHGKVKIEGEEYENSTSNDIGILINHTQSNLSDIPVQDENKNVLQEEGSECLDQEKSKAMEKPTAATVFTIDFDEDKKVKKDLNLSDHIPSRIREKLEARKKAKSPEADSAKKTTSSTKDNTKNLERTPLRSSKRLSNGVKTQESKSSDTKPTQNKTLKTQTSKKTDTRKQSTEYDPRTYKVKRNNSTTDTRKSSSTPEADKEKRLSSSKSIPITGKKIRRLSKSPESVASTKSSKSTGASSKVGVDKKKKLLVQSQVKSFDSETSSSRAKAKASSPSSTTKSKVTVKQSRLIEECSTSLDSSQLVDGKSYLMEKLFEGTEIIQQTITQHEAVPLTTQLSLPDDNVSNSGTYTIDDDDEEVGNEEEEARQRIDEVFGVSELSQVVKGMSLQDDVYTGGNLSDGSTCTPTDDIKRRSFTFDQPDNLDNKQYVDFEELKAMAIQQGGEVPLWMSQLVALTNQNLQQSSHTVSPSLDTSFSSRSPVDNGKKRPGTGRRLPPIPTNHSTSLLSQSSPLSDTINSVPENGAKHSPRPPTSKQSPKHSPVASTTSKKPFVSSTRPNRAFELRRSNATEGSTRRKSTSSVASASPPVSRRSEPKTERSSASSSSRTPRAKAKSTHLSNLKKELKRTSIGESSKKPVSKSQSTPASRNNSPKTLSWKRRMEYDPRKAVSEAKEKSKRLVKQSQSVAVDTVKSTSNLVRSSSCSNSEELCGLGSMKELSRSCMHKSAFSTPSPKDLRNMSPLQRSASLRIRRSTFDTVTDQDVQQNGLNRTESYNPLLVSSIYQLSLQLKSQLDKTVEKLKDEEKISVTPSPIDDFLEEPEKSQFPAWKTANNELISILKNLRRIKHQMQAVDSVLFPTTSDQTLDQIHRLSLEITEFHPIGNEEDFSDEGSPDLMEEFY